MVMPFSPISDKVFQFGLDLINNHDDPEKYDLQNKIDDLNDSDKLYIDAEDMMEEIFEGLSELD